ncbi:MAG: hypothetical protein P0Y65_20555 [Candidatus Devosia phytovorans]|uniref:Uncharacterized protein n=1 Tax=Candidatus Devosia phytovorans TaxID=3121372 RepID=A0AAJ5VW74_9HYPH|nr:hypothetical protein [Devosia sp.]WEK04534.1 MAG: hypothetical protein P0Y65_20555 [Devosia sp.]
MTRVLAITRRQADTLFAAADKAGGIVEVETPIGTIRIIPAALAGKPKPIDKEPEGYL